MPAATVLPASNVVVRFPPSSLKNAGEESYQLLELPNEILKRVEASSEPLPLTIKGRPSDDAVLCTPDSTFLLRTVSISNSLLVLRVPPSSSISSSSSSRPTLQIRDVCHEVLEPIPHAPNVERIRTILRDSAWSGLGAEEGEGSSAVLGKRRRGEEGKEGRGKKYTRAQLESVIQASDGELERGLRDRNVIEVEGRMLLLPAPRLQPLLTIILTLLTIHAGPVPSDTASASTARVSADTLLEALREHEVGDELARGVMRLFSDVDWKGEVKGVWVCDTRRAVKYVGLGLLESLKGESKPSTLFIEEWKVQVGETWADLVDLSLLEGEYIMTTTGASLSSSTLITPFPSHALSLHAATRFSDLFLTRPQWRPDEMAPFLRGLTREGDTKERDKLIAKFVRIVKERDGTWWFPRRSA